MDKDYYLTLFFICATLLALGLNVFILNGKIESLESSQNIFEVCNK